MDEIRRELHRIGEQFLFGAVPQRLYDEPTASLLEGAPITVTDGDASYTGTIRSVDFKDLGADGLAATFTIVPDAVITLDLKRVKL